MIDVFDSRDAEERIKELETLDDRDEEDQEELNMLLELREEVDSGEWEYGIGFIADSYFTEYARQLAEDIGAISDDAQWPATCIDWEEAAEQLKQDYTSIEYNGETYWYRA